METFIGQQTQRQLVAHGDYAGTAKCWEKIPVIFQGMFGTFRVFLTFFCIYSTISHGAHSNVLQNPGWKTLALRVSVKLGKLRKRI
jgi:hypothetical protein